LFNCRTHLAAIVRFAQVTAFLGKFRKKGLIPEPDQFDLHHGVANFFRETLAFKLIQ
jgi:hypothetical protein